jgi:hypothetical protein
MSRDRSKPESLCGLAELTGRVANFIETPMAEKTESAWQPGKTGIN